MRRFSQEPVDRPTFTARFDRFYTRFATAYDLLIKLFPVWKKWLRHAIPHLHGPRILEVSFGTGWLMTQYADRAEVHGVDLNARMIAVARKNLQQAGLTAELLRASVEALPFADACFDTVLSTMAFSGYPDAQQALTELLRVLKPDGRLVIIDVNYPTKDNWAGAALTRFWMRAGDIVRDMGALFDRNDLTYSDEEIGGWGSIHLYVAQRPLRTP